MSVFPTALDYSVKLGALENLDISGKILKEKSNKTDAAAHLFSGSTFRC